MKSLWIACAAIVVASGSMLADTISSTGTLSAFPVNFAIGTPTWISNATNPGPPTNGTPFWNNASDDTGVGSSHLMNIGYGLTGTGGFASSILTMGETTTGATDLTNGLADVPFSFVRNAAAYNISLLYANSGLNTGHSWLQGTAAVGSVIGYYVGSTFTPIYTVGQTTSVTGTQAFNPGGSGTVYGFYDTICYAVSAGVCTDFATYTTGGQTVGNDTGGSAWNHFALFQLASGSYVLGFTGQNGVFGEYHGDYQDTVIEISLAPEPGTVAIMGLGLAALGLLGRRRFVKK
jgi:hypothetical protein